jgi:peptide subunit release factor 1 (eRF1)
MAEKKVVHFKCQHCGTPYTATREEIPKEYSGIIDCVDCGKPAHEWTGFYNLIDWRPARMRRPPPMGTPL